MDGAGRTTERPTRRRASTLRRNLRASTIDGACYMVMLGLAETYFAAFVLELGLGEVAAGLILTVPMLLAALAQLGTPGLVRRLGSYRGFVIGSAGFQALSLLPLAAVAMVGSAPAWLVFLLVTLYWLGPVAGGPAWTSWMGVMVPGRVRSRFFGYRNRWLQAGVLAGIVVGGLTLRLSNVLDARNAALPEGQRWFGGADLTLPAFALIFLLAGVFRAVSTRYLVLQTQPSPLPVTERGVGVRELAGRLSHSADGRLIVYLFIAQGTLQMALPFWHPYVREQLQFNYLEYVALLAAAYVGRMLALPAWGRLAQARGPKTLLWVGGLATVPLSVLWLASDTFAWLLAAQLIGGVALAAFELGSFLMQIECVRPEERTSVVSKFTAVHSMGMAAGSVAGGAMLGPDPGARAYEVLFIVASLARVLTIPVLIAVRRAAERQPSAPGAPGAPGAPIAVLPAPASPERTLAPAPGEEVIAESVLREAGGTHAGSAPRPPAR